MNTTNLFVELVVIGVGAFLWLALLVLACFGHSWISIDVVGSTLFAIPILALIYVLGIVFDRIADVLFEYIWTEKLRATHFTNKAEYYDARRQILTTSERLSDLIEYGRSRLRICRGWAFHCVLLSAAFNTYLWSQHNSNTTTLFVALVGTTIMLGIAFASWFAWRQLTVTGYRKIKEQAKYLRAHESILVQQDSS